MACAGRCRTSGAEDSPVSATQRLRAGLIYGAPLALLARKKKQIPPIDPDDMLNGRRNALASEGGRYNGTEKKNPYIRRMGAEALRLGADGSGALEGGLVGGRN